VKKRTAKIKDEPGMNNTQGKEGHYERGAKKCQIIMRAVTNEPNKSTLRHSSRV